jgi:hypothetical protein
LADAQNVCFPPTAHKLAIPRELPKSLRADERCNFLCLRHVGVSQRASCSSDHNPERVHMNKLILFAGVGAFAFGTPAVAQHGNGRGNGHGNQGNTHSEMSHGKAYAKSNGRAYAKSSSSHAHGGNRLYAFNDRGNCPPGLAKRNNGCLPPGQARKTYNVGQRYNRNFGNLWAYNEIPTDLRSRYDFSQSDRYYYRNGYLYQVDPKTMLVQQVISALLR